MRMEVAVLNEHKGIALVDGAAVHTEKQLQEALRPGVLVRIRTHVYKDGKALTVGAPTWPYPSIRFPKEEQGNG